MRPEPLVKRYHLALTPGPSFAFGTPIANSVGFALYDCPPEAQNGLPRRFSGQSGPPGAENTRPVSAKPTEFAIRAATPKVRTDGRGAGYGILFVA